MSAPHRGGALRLMHDTAADQLRLRESTQRSTRCPTCQTGWLTFFLAEFGQTIEQCSNVRCTNALPHRPVPDPDAAAVQDPKWMRHRDRERERAAAAEAAEAQS